MDTTSRVFTPDELSEFSKDNIGHALEALDRGDIETAKAWLRKHEETKNYIHDIYMHWVAKLMTHIYDHWGEEAAVAAIGETVRDFSLPTVAHRQQVLRERGLRGWVQDMISGWRQHASHPGLTVEEDDEKITVNLNPCGSGGRLINAGAYDGPDGYRRLKQAGPHTWGETDVPIYCSHCAFAHELVPEGVGGKEAKLWFHASPFPKKPGDPCIHHYYKDPKNIPER